MMDAGQPNQPSFDGLNIDLDAIDLAASVRGSTTCLLPPPPPHPRHPPPPPKTDELFQTPMPFQHARTSSPSPIAAPELQQLIQHEVKRALSTFEVRVSGMLDGVTEELAAEVEREQRHLMLMQDSIDKTNVQLTRELAEMHKQLQQERTQRAHLLASVRESRDNMLHQMSSQALEIARLRRALDSTGGGWGLIQLWSQVAGTLTCCQPLLGPVQQQPATVPPLTDAEEQAVRTAARVEQVVYAAHSVESPARSQLQSPIKASDAARRGVLSPKKSPLAVQPSQEREALIAAVHSPGSGGQKL